MFPKEEEEEEEDEDERRLRPRSLMIMLALVGGAAMLMLFYDGFGGLRYHHQRNKSNNVQGVLHPIRLTRGRIRPLTFFFYMTMPPSTWIVWPVIYAAAGSNAKNLTMPAISSG